jgi:glycosyltransferase
VKITVITVAFNNVRTIADTLSSVSGQSHGELEHIVIDGGSTDGTQDVVRKHGAGSVKIFSEPDRGIYHAMNKGIQRASGELIGFLNADDVFADSSVVADIARVAAQQGSDIVFGDLVYVLRDRTDIIVRYWRSDNFNPSRLRFGWMAPHPTFYVRRALTERLGVFNDSLRISGDYDFMLRYLMRSELRVSYIGRVLVRMRTGGASGKSIRELVRKSSEDLYVIRRNELGGWFTLFCKNARKILQFTWSNGRPPKVLSRS